MAPLEAWPGGPHPAQIAALDAAAQGLVYVPQRSTAAERQAAEEVTRRHKARFAKRLAAVVEALVAAGSPELVRRFTTHTEYQRRPFGRHRAVNVEVEVEPAWPVGLHRLRLGSETFDVATIREVEAAITTAGRPVPLDAKTFSGPCWFNDWNAAERAADALNKIAARHGIQVSDVGESE